MACKILLVIIRKQKCGYMNKRQHGVRGKRSCIAINLDVSDKVSTGLAKSIVGMDCMFLNS